jgi:REP element-mobilizing transposase RayT
MGPASGKMARKLRVQFPGAVYHVMNRGDRREPIFEDDEDRRLFLKTLGQSCDKTDWQMHAWCLMDNHFHLVLETPRGNLVEGMKWLLGTYTIRFNHRHQEFGHLFSGRYKALMVEGSGNGYLKAVGDYVHLNPVRAGLLRPEQPLQDYAWSSYPLYLKEAAARPGWLRVDRLLGEWGIPMDTLAGREQFARRVEARRRAEIQGDFEPPARGWCAGSERFRQELLAQVQALAGPKHRGEEMRESALAKAERMVQAEVAALGWTEFDLAARRKGDLRKVRIAARLRRQTTMTLEWIATRLHMGAGTYVAHLLNQQQRKEQHATNCTKTLF